MPVTCHLSLACDRVLFDSVGVQMKISSATVSPTGLSRDLAKDLDTRHGLVPTVRFRITADVF
jgi:hypothetical protein